MEYNRTSRDEDDALRKELEAVPREDRLDFLAGLPRERQVRFKRILPPGDITKLIEHIDRQVARRAKPSYETWLAEARAGRAANPDAMIEALREIAAKLRPQDAMWISRIADTASAGSYSSRQEQVIRSIYARYFRPATRRP